MSDQMPLSALRKTVQAGHGTEGSNVPAVMLYADTRHEARVVPCARGWLLSAMRSNPAKCIRGGLGSGPLKLSLSGAGRTGVKRLGSVRQSPNGKERPSLLLQCIIPM